MSAFIFHATLSKNVKLWLVNNNKNNNVINLFILHTNHGKKMNCTVFVFQIKTSEQKRFFWYLA